MALNCTASGTAAVPMAFSMACLHFLTGSKKDRRKSDPFLHGHKDHIADYSFIALFFHTVQKDAGAFPVIYGEGENIYMDAGERSQRFFCDDSQDWKPKSGKFGPGILGHFNTAQYIIIANTNIDDRDMHRLGDHLGCVCTEMITS